MARALRPGLSIRGGTGGFNYFASNEIAAPTNRWAGQNRNGYSSSDYDRLYDQFNNTLDAAKRVNFQAQMEKIITDEVPGVMLYFQAQATAHLAALKGPENTPTPAAGGGVLRIYDWAWQP